MEKIAAMNTKLKNQQVAESEPTIRPDEPQRSVNQADLELPVGEPNMEALRSATREWLVPVLVERFLRVHGIELKYSRRSVKPKEIVRK